MTLETNFNTSPYFDDYQEDKQFQKILFKPSVAVQTRELNQLQTIIQKQIERFGDNIFKEGTIIDGCSFTYHNYYPYVKITDSQTDGQPTISNAYVGHFVKNSSNLIAYVLDSKSGFESQDPNLNTLYLRYINSGDTFDQTAFSNAQILTVYNSNNSVFKTEVNNGGLGFSNNDTVVILPAVVVNVSSSNTFSNGELITQATTGAKAVIIEVNTTAIADSLILKLKPLTTDLVNTAANTMLWEFSEGFSITSNTSSSVANVEQLLGTEATGSILTDSIGQVQSITILNGGENYLVEPYTTIKPLSATASVNDLNLSTKNYKAKITVASVTNSGGSGYAFGVSEGIIYQKGYFLFVAPQTTIVSKYSNTPDLLAVGFNTSELIVNSNIDDTLLDNSTGTFNYQAPGADRLKLTPSLITISKADADANDRFFALTEFSEGLAFKQNKQTAYNLIEDEMAQRTFESAGDYVLDPFLVGSKTSSNSLNESNTFTLVLDPGHAYISGYRIRTETNFAIDAKKGVDTQTTSNNSISLNYGNYIFVNELGGSFLFTTADVISLRDATKQYISNTSNISAGATPTSAGNEIGTARIRSLVYESGTPGTSSAVYRLYLFDINMNAGKNFRNVRSIFYNGSSVQGVADLVLSLDPTTSTNVAQVVNSNASELIFNISSTSLKTVNNIIYTYRALNANIVANTTGILTVSLVASGETFDYTQGSTLTTAQQTEVIAVPLANGQASANLLGTFSGNTSSNIVSSNAGNLITDILPGDYIKITEGANSNVKRISNIINSSSAFIDSPLSFATSAANAALFFPHHVPITIASHPLRSINVDSAQTTLKINLGTGLLANVTFAVVHNILVTNPTQSVKTPNRNSVVKINIANNVGGSTGPWVLGVPDVFRLKGVYLNSNISSISTSDTNVTNEFYIDHNQNKDYYDTSYLYLNPTSSLSIVNTNALLVVFDNFTTSSNNLFTISSYTIDDNKSLAELDATSSINTHEIPELISAKDDYFDLINSADFRIYVSNTATITANASLATINPAAPQNNTKFGNTANPANSYKFPVPDSVFISNVEKYLGRALLITVNSEGDIKLINGVPSTNNFAIPKKSTDSLIVNVLNIPPYPSDPDQKSSNALAIIDKKIANERFTTVRDSQHIIDIATNTSLTAISFQPPRYSMEDISNLERRIEVLEYHVNLNQLETEIKDKTIPSSVNPTLDRFKYGFFADNFTTENFTDLDNPEYNAAFVNNEVVPSNIGINFSFEFNSSNATTNNAAAGKLLALPYTPFDLISQLNATTVANVVANTTTPNTVNQTTVCVFKHYNQNQAQIDEYLFSSNSGTTTITWNDGWVDSGDGFKIYQGLTSGFSIVGKTPIAISNNGITPTANDETQFLQAGGPSPDNFGVRSIPASWGKIVYTHIPSQGRYYRIVPNSIPRNGWDYLLCYPTDSNNVVIQPPITTPPTNKYIGTLTSDPGTILTYTKSTSGNRFTPAAVLNISTTVNFSVSGLKPLTKHFFFFDNTDVSANTIPNGGTVGAPLITDSTGKLNFSFVFTPPNATKNPKFPTSLFKPPSILSKVLGPQSSIKELFRSINHPKVGILKTVDGLSSASVTLNTFIVRTAIL